MKKILATVLALTMIVGMSITVFATNHTESPAEDLVLNDTVSITVQGTYEKKAATTDETPVYAVDIEWTAISFKFTESANVMTWDPDALAYVVGTTGTHTDGVWSGDSVDIEITNRSNAGVVVTPSYVAAEGGATVNFTDAVTLGTAVGAGEAGANAATTDTITVSKPTSGSISGDKALGTLTLTITAA